MATWNSDNIILTKLGEQMLSKVQAGIGKLTVSRIVSGAGHVSPAQLYNQTQVTDIKQELFIVKYSTNESQSVISVNMSNTELAEAYDLYQIGIYATHPDFEGEVLYLIAQCDSPDHIPVAGDNPVTLSYDLVMAHSGTKEVVINVSEAGHVDVTTFTKFVENTNTALSNILNDVKGKMDYIDLGDIETDLDNCVGEVDKTVCYYCKNWKNSPASPAWVVAMGGKVDNYETKSGAVIVINENYTNSVFTPWTVDKNKGFVSQLFIPMGGLSPYTRSTAGLDSSWKCVSDGGNAAQLGSIPASELDRVRCAVVGGTKAGVQWTGIDSTKGDTTIRAQVDADYDKIFLFKSTDGQETWTEIELNADTVDGKHANSFMQDLGGITTGSLLEYALSIGVSGVLVAGPGVTDTPNPGRTFFIEVRNYNGYLELIACETGTGTISVNNYNRNQWYGWKTGGGSDTLDGKHASEFLQNITQWKSGSVKDHLLATKTSGVVWIDKSCTGLPTNVGATWWYGIVLHSASHYCLIVTNINNNSTFAITYNAGTTPPSWTNWRDLSYGGNAIMVNGHTVQSDVPANAKFTDTTYKAGSNIAIDSNNVITNTGVIRITSKIKGAITYECGGSLPLTADVAINGLGSAAYQGLQTNAGTVGIHRMSAGTAEANDTNCPVGCWYGQYE